jgi:two-component system LytT family response regulator
VIRALIVDDEPLARSRVRLLLTPHADVEVIAECSSGREAAAVMASEVPNLLFLDVELPEVDGFTIAASRDLDCTPAIVFVTAHDEFALQAFDANAVDYMVKPFSQERFDRGMDRVRRFLGHGSAALAPNARTLPPRRRERFAIRVRGQVLFVKANDVEWIAAEGNYARLHTSDASYLIRESLQHLESELEPEMFVRVHRSAIVNIERVRKLIVGAEGTFSIVLQSDASVPLGPTYRERLEGLLGQKL